MYSHDPSISHHPSRLELNVYVMDEFWVDIMRISFRLTTLETSEALLSTLETSEVL